MTRPLAVAVAIYLAIVAAALWVSLTLTGGSFTYAQDDPYIHLTMARNLAEYGVWGIAPDTFVAASSSPLWTLLLATLWTLGARAVWMPFLLNVVCGVAVIAVADRVSRDLVARHRLALLTSLVVVTPLPTLAFIGMEHTLQVVLVLLFASQVSDRLASGASDWILPSVVGALMVATRYECLFLVAVVSAALAWKRRWGAALLMTAAGALPVVLFATYSLSHGGLILPNSVLMKSVPGRFESFGSGVAAVLADWVSARDLFLRPPQLALTLAAVVTLMLTPAARVAAPDRRVWLAVVFVATSVLHACLVKLEWFYRYEAYLMALGLLAVVSVSPLAEIPRGVPRKRATPLHPAAVVLMVLLAMPLAVRALESLAVTPQATRNLHEQQIQLGRFFARYYSGRPVAVNDIGAVGWMSSSRILDIVGLASQPVADLKRRRALDAVALERLAADVDAIAVYADIFEPVLPASWVKAGDWTIDGVVAVSGKTVTFFAPDEVRASRLEGALREDSRSLPPGVTLWLRGDRPIPRQ